MNDILDKSHELVIRIPVGQALEFIDYMNKEYNHKTVGPVFDAIFRALSNYVKARANELRNESNVQPSLGAESKTE